MSRTYHRHHRDEDILQDGERRRVPMTAMDGVQRAIAQHGNADHANLSDAERRAVELTKQKLAADGVALVTDGEGHGGLALRRPGARFADAAGQQELTRARQQYVDEFTNAWRGDQRRSDADDDDDDVETGDNQEGAKSRRRRSQYRDPEGVKPVRRNGKRTVAAACVRTSTLTGR